MIDDMDRLPKSIWEFHLWHECMGDRCDQVQQRNHRLDKRGNSGQGPEN